MWCQWLAQSCVRYTLNFVTRLLTDDPGREELLDSFPLFLPALLCTGDTTALRLPDGGLLAERGWDEVGGREPGDNNSKAHHFNLVQGSPGYFLIFISKVATTLI